MKRRRPYALSRPPRPNHIFARELTRQDLLTTLRREQDLCKSLTQQLYANLRWLHRSSVSSQRLGHQCCGLYPNRDARQLNFALKPLLLAVDVSRLALQRDKVVNNESDTVIAF